MTLMTQTLETSDVGQGDGLRAQEWVALILLALNVVFIAATLLIFTVNPDARSSVGCETEQFYLPTKGCYWMRAMPVPGTETSRAELFLPVDSQAARAGRNFGLFMLAAAAVSVYGLARKTNWRSWAVGLTVLVGLLSWGRWSTIPINFEAMSEFFAILFVISMAALSIAGVYGFLTRKRWVTDLLVATGAYGTLIGAFWVTTPVALFQIILGIVLILLLLESQGKRQPPLVNRVLNWTALPVFLVIVLVIIHTAMVAPAEGITAGTLNWRTIFGRSLEHIKVVLVASLAAIATAVPAGILITRQRKFSARMQRVLTAIPQAVLIGAGYGIPWLIAWWLQDPVAIEGAGDLLRALSGPIFWALIIGGGIHWLIYTQTRAQPNWGAIDSWRSLAPAAINIANIGQTVPSLAVLGLSMSFLGIGFTPAIFALWIRALLPILRNTVAGIMSVDADVIEAATGMGMTRNEVLFRIELPLSMAVIFAGIRTAVVFNVGVGALAFYIGAGGLGHLIAIGISLSNDAILLAGGILTAWLAVLADFIMSHIEERLVPPSAAASPN